nr:bacteriocin fulvocin C-related protein [uncultured Flavobacterium sp.]
MKNVGIRCVKNLKLYLLLCVLLFIVGTIFVACSSTSDERFKETSIDSNLRKDFLEGKNFDEVKKDFSELETKKKYALWNDKINQLLTQKLPDEHVAILKQLKVELVNMADDKPNKIPELAIQLAKITPKQDFIRMFAELEDYKYEGRFHDDEKISNEIINTFRTVISNRTMEADRSSTKTSKKKKCNCSWTCDSTVGGYTTNCEETTSGCGFMWAFPCTGRVFDLTEPTPALPTFPKDSLGIKP